MLLGGRCDVSFEGEEVEVGGDGGWPGSLRGLAEFQETEADEAAIPVNVGFLSGHGLVLETDGATQDVDEAIEFAFALGGPFGRGRREDGQFGWDADGLPSEGPVIRFKGVGLIGQSPPVKSSRPRDLEDIAGQNAGRIDGLAEVPIGQMG